MRIKNERDFWSGLVFVLLAIAFGVGASNHPIGNAAAPGPGYFPLLLSLLLALLGLMVLFKSLVIEAEDGGAIGAVAWRACAAISLALVIFAAALPRLGLIASVALLVIVASFAAKGGSGRAVLLSAAAVCAVCWLVFGPASHLLPVSIPVALWPRGLA